MLQLVWLIPILPAAAATIIALAGRRIGDGVIKGDPEGIVVFEPPSRPGEKWILIADQERSLTRLRFFDAKSGAYAGAVVGQPSLANTDGIALEMGDYGPFVEGALYCVHNDVRVHAYSMADLLASLPPFNASRPSQGGVESAAAVARAASVRVVDESGLRPGPDGGEW